MNKSSKYKRIAIFFIAISIGLFGYSLTQYGLLGEGGGYRQDQMGWELLVFGFFTVPQFPAWLANPMLLLGWILSFLKKHHFATYASIAALSLMLSTMLIESVDIDPTPVVMEITGYGIGFYLWIASAVFLLASNAVLTLYVRQKSQQSGKKEL